MTEYLASVPQLINGQATTPIEAEAIFSSTHDLDVARDPLKRQAGLVGATLRLDDLASLSTVQTTARFLSAITSGLSYRDPSRFSEIAAALGLDWTPATLPSQDQQAGAAFVSALDYVTRTNRAADLVPWPAFRAAWHRRDYGTHAPGAVANGYSTTLPIRPGQKSPALPAWSRICVVEPSAGERAAMLDTFAHCGLGIAGGRGFLWLDVDQPAQADAWRAELAALAGCEPDALPVRVSPNAGRFAYLLRYSAEPGELVPNGAFAGNDVRGHGAQVVVMGAHPSGDGDYQTHNWHPATTPASFHYEIDWTALAGLLRRVAARCGIELDQTEMQIATLDRSRFPARAAAAPVEPTLTISSTGSTGGSDFLDRAQAAAERNPGLMLAMCFPGQNPVILSDGSHRYVAHWTASGRGVAMEDRVPTLAVYVGASRFSITDYGDSSRGYNTITLVAAALGVSKGQAVAKLADLYGIGSPTAAPGPVEPVQTPFTSERAQAELAAGRIALPSFTAMFVEEAKRFNMSGVLARRESAAFADILQSPTLYSVPAGVWNAHCAASLGKSTALQVDIVALIMSDDLTRPFVYACHDKAQGRRFAQELREKLEAAGDTFADRVVEIFGRDETNCEMHERVKALRNASPSINQRNSLCESGGGKCPFFDGCAFIRSRNLAKSPNGRVIITTHAMLHGFPFLLPADVFATVIDEDQSASAASEHSLRLTKLIGLLHDTSHDKAAIATAAGDPQQQHDHLLAAIRMVREGMGSLKTEALLSRDWLLANGFTVEALRGALACLFAMVQKTRVEFTPGELGRIFADQIERLKEHGKWVAAHKTMLALVEIITDTDATGPKTITAGPDDYGNVVVIVRERQPLAPKFTRKPVMVLSATADETRIRETVGAIKRKLSVHPVLDPHHNHVEYVQGAPTATGAAVEGSRTLRGVRRAVLELHARKPGKTLVIATKKACDLLLKMDWPEGQIEIVHFAIAVGRNDFEGYEKILIYGQERPKPASVENLALAITGKLVRLPAGASFYDAQHDHRLALDGTAFDVTTYSHPSALALSLFDRACNDGIAQAFARVRPLNAPADGRVIEAVIMTSTLPDSITPSTVRQWGSGRESLLWEYVERHGFYPIGSDRLCVMLAPDFWIPKAWKGATPGMLMADALRRVEEAKRAEGYPTQPPLGNVIPGVLESIGTPGITLPSREPAIFTVREPGIRPYLAVDPFGLMSADDVLAILREHMGDDVLVDGSTATKASMSAARVGACSNSPALAMLIDQVAYPNKMAFQRDKAGLVDPMLFAASRPNGVVYSITVPRSPAGPQHFAVDLDHGDGMQALLAIRRARPTATITRTSGEPESLPHALLREFVHVAEKQTITVSTGVLAMLARYGVERRAA